MGSNQSSEKKKAPNHTNVSNLTMKRNKSLKRTKSVRGEAGYFLVKFKKKQIKIVNAENVELCAVESIIRYALICFFQTSISQKKRVKIKILQPKFSCSGKDMITPTIFPRSMVD